jgi:hypothetical protein
VVEVDAFHSCVNSDHDPPSMDTSRHMASYDRVGAVHETVT